MFELSKIICNHSLSILKYISTCCRNEQKIYRERLEVFLDNVLVDLTDVIIVNLRSRT